MPRILSTKQRRETTRQKVKGTKFKQETFARGLAMPGLTLPEEARKWSHNTGGRIRSSQRKGEKVTVAANTVNLQVWGTKHPPTHQICLLRIRRWGSERKVQMTKAGS